VASALARHAAPPLPRTSTTSTSTIAVMPTKPVVAATGCVRSVCCFMMMR
jgi:hypothetical protein